MNSSLFTLAPLYRCLILLLLALFPGKILASEESFIKAEQRFALAISQLEEDLDEQLKNAIDSLSEFQSALITINKIFPQDLYPRLIAYISGRFIEKCSRGGDSKGFIFLPASRQDSSRTFTILIFRNLEEIITKSAYEAVHQSHYCLRIKAFNYPLRIFYNLLPFQIFSALFSQATKKFYLEKNGIDLDPTKITIFFNVRAFVNNKEITKPRLDQSIDEIEFYAHMHILDTSGRFNFIVPNEKLDSDDLAELLNSSYFFECVYRSIENNAQIRILFSDVSTALDRKLGTAEVNEVNSWLHILEERLADGHHYRGELFNKFFQQKETARGVEFTATTFNYPIYFGPLAAFALREFKSKGSFALTLKMPCNERIIRNFLKAFTPEFSARANLDKASLEGCIFSFDINPRSENQTGFSSTFSFSPIKKP